jgi:hypothetical protein
MKTAAGSHAMNARTDALADDGVVIGHEGSALLVLLRYRPALYAFIALIATGIWTECQLMRPPQDWLTRTWLVPR